MLTELAEIGMAIAEAAGRRACALAEGGEADAPDPGLSFARAARAVRLTIALQARLAGDLASLERGESLALAAEAARRRERAHRLVERTIEGSRDDADEIERLSSAAWERLTDQDDADLAARPLGEVVARICQDLGLSPDWNASTFAAEAFPEEGAAFAGPPADGDPGAVRIAAAALRLAARARASPARRLG